MKDIIIEKSLLGGYQPITKRKMKLLLNDGWFAVNMKLNTHTITIVYFVLSGFEVDVKAESIQAINDYVSYISSITGSNFKAIIK